MTGSQRFGRPHDPDESLSGSRDSSEASGTRASVVEPIVVRRTTAWRPLFQVIQQIVLRDLPKSRESGVESGFGLGQVAGRGWEISTNETILLLA